MGFGKILQKALPWIGAAATSGVPGLIGMAAKTVSGALGKEIGDKAEDIMAAIQGATPEQLLALKKADQDFKLQMEALGFKHVEELERISADDRASARAREMAVKDSTPRVLAYLVAGGFFGLLTTLVFHPLPEAGKDAALLLLGALSTAFVGIIQYYYGSSAGSARKTDLLANGNGHSSK
jgi:hypothetical protein